MSELKVGQEYVGKLKNQHQNEIIIINEQMVEDEENTLYFLHYFGFDFIDKTDGRFIN